MTVAIHRVRAWLEARIGADLPAGAFATLSLRFAHLALEFLALMLLARLLDSGAFGVYAVAMTCAMVLGVPATAGFDRLLVREVAAHLAGERWGLLHGVLQRATQFAMTSSILLSVALAILAVVIGNLRGQALGHALLLAAAYLPLIAFARMRQAAMQGLGRVPQGIVTETLVQPATLLLLAASLFTVGGLPRGGANAMALQVVSAIAAMLTGSWLLRRLWPPPARSAAPEYQTSRWLGSAAPMMWMLGMNMLLTCADTLMLGWLLDGTVAGRYRVASQAAMLVSLPMTAINLAVAPGLAQRYSQDDLPGLRRHAARATRWSFFAAIPVALGLLVAGPLVLGMFGPGFTSVYQPLLILAAGYVVNSFSGAAGYVLIMTKHERLAAWTFTVAAITNVLANYALIPRYGTLGAAFSTAGSVSLVGIGLWSFARFHFPARSQ